VLFPRAVEVRETREQVILMLTERNKVVLPVMICLQAMHSVRRRGRGDTGHGGDGYAF
jgi:hypothetical protein